MITINDVKINLYDTITCGQIFRYTTLSDNSFIVILDDRVVKLTYKNNTLYVESNNYDKLEEKIKKYLDLNRDYEAINQKILSADISFQEIINDCKGFKIIQSYSFETILSYIISANKGLSSITSSVNLLSKRYGSKIVFENIEYYLFPTKEQLKHVSVEEYRECKVGFRDIYLYNIVRAINDKTLDIDSLYNMSSDDAMHILMTFKGIGPKVASCILLFAYQKLDVFPIDTWVKKYMLDIYKTDNTEKITKIIKEKFGDFSSVLIQYIYHSNRNLKL